MANKSNQNQPGQESGSVPGRTSRANEFDDAVTTDIPDDLTETLDEHQAGDSGGPVVTDVSLTEYADPASEESLPPGFLLRDRFEIVELVYAAGMSQVYKAVDRLRRPEGAVDIHVAIKTMRPSIVANDEARLSLEREASISQSLPHPNIINIFDFNDHDGQFFLVMEWLEGESVNALLRRTSGNGVDAGLAQTVITGTAIGVQHAHRNNVVHADINPSNIFITDTQEIKLLDFGVARITSTPEQSEEERFGWVTQTYASPEVLSGVPPVVEDDVFSLACVAYRLLAGKHPFGGTLSLIAKEKQLSVEPVPGLPAREWEILCRALSYERSDRPGSVDDFVTWGTRVAGNDEFVDQAPRRPKPNQWTWLAALAAVVVLAGGFWLYQAGVLEEIMAPVERALPEEAVLADPAISTSEALVAAAMQALGDGQLVEPDEVNARALFRAALVLEPQNAEALRGLRTISDDFVQQAQAALSGDELTEAYAALNVATETDPANPAIGIVEQLVMAKGDAELAAARLALTTGELDMAAQQASRAAQYRHIEPGAIQAVRRQIEERRQSDLLRERLAAEVAPGSESLDAVEAPGEPVAEAEPEAEPESMSETVSEAVPEADPAGLSQTAADSAPETVAAQDIEESPGPQVASEQSGDALEPGDVEVPEVAEEPLESTALQSTASEAPVPEEVAPEAAAAPAEPEIRRLSLQELGITKYTAPKFPRRALRRNLSGLVEVKFIINTAGRTESVEILRSEPGDVFSQSAVNAINQWRFETREKPMNAQITLRFDQE